MRKIRLCDSCLNHLTNIPVGFTGKSSYIHTLWEITYIPKILCILLTGGAYAPDATCIATPLARSYLQTATRLLNFLLINPCRQPWIRWPSSASEVGEIISVHVLIYIWRPWTRILYLYCSGYKLKGYNAHDDQVRLQQLCIDRRDGHKSVKEVLRALGHSIRLNLLFRHSVTEDRCSR